MSAEPGRHGWLAVRYQTLNSLVELSAEWGIAPSQVASIVESPSGSYTLLFEPTPEQRALYDRSSRPQGDGGAGAAVAEIVWRAPTWPR